MKKASIFLVVLGFISLAVSVFINEYYAPQIIAEKAVNQVEDSASSTVEWKMVQDYFNYIYFIPVACFLSSLVLIILSQKD